jgi:hypothetical protein
MGENKATLWETYDKFDVRKISHQNFILKKTINIGVCIMAIQIMCLISFVIYMCIQDDFTKIIFSDATEHICMYQKGKIHSGN